MWISQTDYYVLVYDCGGETNVKGYLMAQRDKLISNGYTMILGLRDVYPNFQREDVPKLFRGLNHQTSAEKGQYPYLPGYYGNRSLVSGRVQTPEKGIQETDS